MRESGPVDVGPSFLQKEIQTVFAVGFIQLRKGQVDVNGLAVKIKNCHALFLKGLGLRCGQVALEGQISLVGPFV